MKPITAIVLGAGQRGANVYAAYALNFPNEKLSAWPSRVQIGVPHSLRITAFLKATVLKAGRALLGARSSQTVYLSVRRTGCTTSRFCKPWTRAMMCFVKSR